MTGGLVIFAISLAGVILLIFLSSWLRLGSRPSIADDTEAFLLADEILCGFEPAEAAIDASGSGALVSDRSGRILLLAPHGAHFAGRLLDGRCHVKRQGSRLEIAPGEAFVAGTSLDLGDVAPSWERRLAALKG